MLNINVTENGTDVKIELEGKLDAVTSKDLHARIAQLSDNVLHVEIDMENLAYISSAGLRVLLALHNSLKQRGGSLKILHVSDPLMEVFEDTGLATALIFVR